MATASPLKLGSEMPASNLRTSAALGIGEVESIPSNHIDFGMTEQPLSECLGTTIEGVTDPVDVRSIIADNLAALMRARWGEENTNRLAREAKMGAATIQRIKDQSADFRVEGIAKTAAALHVAPWQLLVPEMNPGSMPRLDQRVMSAQANDIATHLDRIADPAIRQRAYAAAIAVISLAIDLPLSGPPSPPFP